MAGPAERLILIGLDGANWPVLDALMEAGRIPWLTRVIRSGQSEILWSEEPTISPALWTTLLTGRSPESHGIRGFAGRDPSSGQMVPSRSSMRRVPAIWSYLDHFGKRVGIVGAHVTWPAEPVDGFVVSRRILDDRFSHTTHPPALADGMEAPDLSDFDALLVESGYLSGEDGDHRTEFMRHFWATDHAAYDVGARELRRSAPDFLFLYFHLTDSAQHVFWPPGEEPPVRGWLSRLLWDSNQWMASRLGWEFAQRRYDFEPIYRVYEHVDRKLAELFEDALTPGTAVMVVSDHGATGTGIATLYERHTEDLLEALGYLERSSLSEEAAAQAHGDPTGEIDFERSLIVPGPQALEEVRLWVNRRNPELAEDPQRRAALATRAHSRLAGLHLEGSGRPLFREIVRTPAEPDVLVARVGISRADADDVVSLGDRQIRAGDLYRPISLGGGHTLEGVVIAAGPPFSRSEPGEVRRGTDPNAASRASLRDVTPTVLAAMGLPIPASLEGRVLRELFDPDLLSHLDLEPRPVGLEWSPFEPPSISDELALPDREMEALRALGYAQ